MSVIEGGKLRAGYLGGVLTRANPRRLIRYLRVGRLIFLWDTNRDAEPRREDEG